MEAGTLAVGDNASGLRRAQGRDVATTRRAPPSSSSGSWSTRDDRRQGPARGRRATGLNGPLDRARSTRLGAVGLTLVYGILKLVNFAHGDFLTFGAYIAYLVNVTWGCRCSRRCVLGVAAIAALGVFIER